MLTSIERLQEDLANRFDNSDSAGLALLAERYQLEALGIGGRRLAVALSQDKIVKLAWRREGLVDNEIEWRLYSQAGDDLKQLLCPSLDLLDCGALVQKRCLPIATSNNEIVRKLASHGISDAAINLGLIGERMVCFDYCLLRPEKLRDLLGGEKSGVLNLDSLG